MALNSNETKQHGSSVAHADRLMVLLTRDLQFQSTAACAKEESEFVRLCVRYSCPLISTQADTHKFIELVFFF